MDKKTLVEILQKGDWLKANHVPYWTKAADRILAALEKEREGDVVVGDCDFAMFKDSKGSIAYMMRSDDKRFNGKTGKLVFIPEAK